MTDSQREPERLAESSDDALLRDLLGAGRAEVGTPEQLEVVASKLAPILGVSVVTGAAKVATVGLLTKVVGVIGIGVIGVVAAVHFAAPSTITHPSSMPSVSSSTPALLEASTEPAASESIPPPIAAISASAKSPESHAPKHSGTPSVVSADTTRTAESEVKLLERAQDALRTNPARAFTLAEEHARLFPDGLLAQEREVIAIDALVRAKRTSEADARAKRFAAAHPGSSHLRRIETLLGHAI